MSSWRISLAGVASASILGVGVAAPTLARPVSHARDLPAAAGGATTNAPGRAASMLPGLSAVTSAIPGLSAVTSVMPGPSTAGSVTGRLADASAVTGALSSLGGAFGGAQLASQQP